MRSGSAGLNSLVYRLRILKAIDKPIEKCTVDEICMKAGVSRQTFYSVFESKYDIVSWWSECSEELFLDRIGIDYSWEEGTLRHLRFLFAKIDVLSSALANSSEEVRQDVSRRRKERMVGVLRGRGIEIDDILAFCVDCYAYELTRSAMAYVNMPESQRPGLVTMAKMLVSIVPAPLYEAMRLPGCGKSFQSDGIAEIDRLSGIIGDEPEPDMFDLLLEASAS